MARRWIMAGALTMLVGAVFLLIMRPSAKPEVDPRIDGTAVLGEEIRAIPADSAWPLTRAAERVTKKPFGIHITPTNSPIQPERFSGYHTGTDFEVFADEMGTNIPVHAICDGIVLEKRKAGGYGGVLVQSGAVNDQPVTVVYGHLRLSSLSAQTGDSIKAGQVIGMLGDAYSDETDGERKHLHLSIHRGTTVNIRGYVNSQSALDQWIDPCDIVCGK